MVGKGRKPSASKLGPAWSPLQSWFQKEFAYKDGTKYLKQLWVQTLARTTATLLFPEAEKRTELKRTGRQDLVLPDRCAHYQDPPDVLPEHDPKHEPAILATCRPTSIRTTPASCNSSCLPPSFPQRVGKTNGRVQRTPAGCSAGCRLPSQRAEATPHANLRLEVRLLGRWGKHRRLCRRAGRRVLRQAGRQAVLASRVAGTNASHLIYPRLAGHLAVPLGANWPGLVGFGIGSGGSINLKSPTTVGADTYRAQQIRPQKRSPQSRDECKQPTIITKTRGETIRTNARGRPTYLRRRKSLLLDSPL